MAGYTPTTKALHWLTVLALGAQFTVGYLLGDDGGRGRGADGAREAAEVAAAAARDPAARTAARSGSTTTAS